MLSPRLLPPLVILFVLVLCWAHSGVMAPRRKAAMPSRGPGGIVYGLWPFSRPSRLTYDDLDAHLLTPPASSSVSEAIVQSAALHNLDPSLIRAIIWVESGFKSRAVSSKGARGLMQLMPATASLTGVKNSFDPADNIRGGTKYLRLMLNRFGGRLELALAAYNAGPGAVENYGGVPPYPETRDYIRKVKRVYKVLKSTKT